MICKNCGKECDGELCQDCKNLIKDDGVDKVTQCPNCKTQRIDNGKFCINCGYNFEEAEKFAQEERAYNNLANESKSNKFFKGIAKIYSFILPTLLLIASVISFWGLNKPLVAGHFDNYPTGYEFIGESVEEGVWFLYSVLALFLLVMAVLCAVYGIIHLIIALTKPYACVKKFGVWVIDAIICIAFIALGAVVKSVANTEGFEKLGLGYVACIVMGVCGLVLLALRIVYELKFFKWQDTGLNYKQIKAIVGKKKISTDSKQKNKEV